MVSRLPKTLYLTHPSGLEAAPHTGRAGTHLGNYCMVYELVDGGKEALYKEQETLDNTLSNC